MNGSQRDPADPGDTYDEPSGPEQYLHPGEELRTFSSDVQIKKFRFEAYLTNRRLFLIDQSERTPGVTAKEIPVEYILGSYLEDSPTREPVIVLSVRTADDDIRTMKMTFAHTGEDRTTEAEEWIHLLAHASPFQDDLQGRSRSASVSPAPGPALSPEARSLSDTIVMPSPGVQPPVRKEEKIPIGNELKPPRKEEKIPIGNELKPPRKEEKIPIENELKPPRKEEKIPIENELKPVRPEKKPSQARPVQKEDQVAERRPPAPAAPPRDDVQGGASGILFCFHCGKKLPPNANFCPYCGTNVHQAVHHDEYAHLPLPLHQVKPEAKQQDEEKKKSRFSRLFGR